jgi:hypothetical protein
MRTISYFIVVIFFAGLVVCQPQFLVTSNCVEKELQQIAVYNLTGCHLGSNGDAHFFEVSEDGNTVTDYVCKSGFCNPGGCTVYQKHPVGECDTEMNENGFISEVEPSYDKILGPYMELRINDAGCIGSWYTKFAYPRNMCINMAGRDSATKFDCQGDDGLITFYGRNSTNCDANGRTIHYPLNCLAKEVFSFYCPN